MVDTYTSNLQILHIQANQDGADVVFNNLANRLDAFQGFVVILDTAPSTTPPGAAVEGAVYTVPASATGDWSTFTPGNLALYNTGWKEIQPWPGLQAFDVRNMKRLRYHGGKWIDMQSASIDDITDSTGGTASTTEYVAYVAPEDVDNNFATVAADLAFIKTALRTYGIIAPESVITKVSDDTVTVPDTNVDVLNP